MISSKNRQAYIDGFMARNAFGSLLGEKLIELNEKECVFEYQVKPEHYNPNGILHGGVLYGVMDSSQGLFVNYILDDQFKYAVTGTSTIKYLAPLKKGLVRVKTYLKETQNRKIFVNSSAYDESGKEVATLEEIWIAILK